MIIYFIIEEPCLGYFTEKVSQTRCGTSIFLSYKRKPAHTEVFLLMCRFCLFYCEIGIGRLRSERNLAYPARAQEGENQGSLLLVNHPFPLDNLAQTRDQRPLRKGERQSGYHSVSFVTFSQFTNGLLLHMCFTLRRRDTR